MDRLEGVERHYDWGSATAIPALLGRPATGRPVAEWWLGAHPSAPARLGPEGRPLDEVIAADPEGTLGPAVAADFGELPFLLKVLAAAEPLSLQVHPSVEQARAGFAREEAAGVPLDAPDRVFRDPHHKPELICALDDFEALCGFRDPADSLALLDTLAVDALEPVRRRLRSRPDGDGLRAALAWLLTRPPGEAADVVATTVAALAAAPAGRFAAEREVATRLAARHPGDPGVVTALLMNRLLLRPGQALFLGAGTLHAYLQGTGIEVMANSDNVVRGGLTTKHVDVEVLIDVVDPTPGVPEILDPVSIGVVTTYPAPVAEFELQRIEVDGVTPIAGGPAILLGIRGRVGVGSHDLARGRSVWVAAGDEPPALDGAGTVFRAAVGRV